MSKQEQMSMADIDAAMGKATPTTAPAPDAAPDVIDMPAATNTLTVRGEKKSYWDSLLDNRKDGFTSVLAPLGIDTARFFKQASLACSRMNDKLAKCDPASVVMSIYQGAELGLDFTPSLGEAYLVPFAGQCTFMPGYRGLMKLAMRSGRIESINATIVHGNDRFEWIEGTSPRIFHTPAPLGTDRGPMVGAYAVARIHGSDTPIFTVMDAATIKQIKAKVVSRNKSGKPSPWEIADAEPEMWRKTAIRRLCKLLTPLGGMDGLARAMEVDDDEDDAPTGPTVAVKIRDVTGDAPADPAMDSLLLPGRA